MGTIFTGWTQWFKLMLKSHANVSVLQRGSLVEDSSIYASEIDFAHSGNEVPTVVMYACSTVRLRIKRSDFDPSVAAISSPLNCFVLEDLWANGGGCFFRERFCDWTVTSMRPSIGENIWSDESNKKSVNGRKLRDDHVIHLKTFRSNCLPFLFIFFTNVFIPFWTS